MAHSLKIWKCRLLMWDHRRMLLEEFAPLFERLRDWLAADWLYNTMWLPATAQSGIGWEKSFGSAASLRETLFRQEWNKYDHVQSLHIQLCSSTKKGLCVTNLESYLSLKTQTVLLRSHSPSQHKQNSKTINLVGPVRKPNTAKALQTLFLSGSCRTRS